MNRDLDMLALILVIALFALLMFVARHPASPAGDVIPPATERTDEVDLLLPGAPRGEPLSGELDATTVPASAGRGAPTHPPPRVVRGVATTYGDETGTGHWNGWVAWPDGPGWRLEVCGLADCATVISNDAGPALERQRAGVVIDLGPDLFERVSGKDWTRGRTLVRVSVLGRVE